MAPTSAAARESCSPAQSRRAVSTPPHRLRRFPQRVLEVHLPVVRRDDPKVALDGPVLLGGDPATPVLQQVGEEVSESRKAVVIACMYLACGLAVVTLDGDRPVVGETPGGTHLAIGDARLLAHPKHRPVQAPITDRASGF